MAEATQERTLLAVGSSARLGDYAPPSPACTCPTPSGDLPPHPHKASGPRPAPETPPRCACPPQHPSRGCTGFGTVPHCPHTHAWPTYGLRRRGASTHTPAGNHRLTSALSLLTVVPACHRRCAHTEAAAARAPARGTAAAGARRGAPHAALPHRREGPPRGGLRPCTAGREPRASRA